MITESPQPPLEWEFLGSSWVSTDTRFFVVRHLTGSWQAYRRQLPQAIDLGTWASEADAKEACEGAK